MNITMRLFLIPCVFFIIPGLNPTINALQPPSAVDAGLIVEQMSNMLVNAHRVKEKDAYPIIKKLIRERLTPGEKLIITVDGLMGVGKTSFISKLRNFVDNVSVISKAKLVEPQFSIDDLTGDIVIVESVGALDSSQLGLTFGIRLHVTVDKGTRMINLQHRWGWMSNIAIEERISREHIVYNLAEYDLIIDNSIVLTLEISAAFLRGLPAGLGRAVTSSH